MNVIRRHLGSGHVSFAVILTTLSALLLLFNPTHGFTAPKFAVHARRSTAAAVASSNKEKPKRWNNSKDRNAHKNKRDVQSQEPNFPVTPRLLAVQALSRKGNALDRLQQSPHFSSLSVRDRAYSRLLVTTVLRQRGQIDALLQTCYSKEPSVLATAALRVGVAQLYVLQTPPHAAVQETVETVKQLGNNQGMVKFVNAVLRRLVRQIQEDSGSNSTVLPSIRTNCAPWLLESLVTDWGDERVDGILQASLQELPRCLSTCQLERCREAFGDSNVESKGSSLLRILSPPSGPVSSWPLFEEGVWWIQDAAAALPAQALLEEIALRQYTSNVTVVDLCAAPGGKTAQLCTSKEADTVIAVEKSAHRLTKLQENVQRLHLLDTSLQMECADGTTWLPLEPVQGVLVDAPCSATGTTSKNPDVLWKSQDSISDLQQTQLQLARQAVQMLEPGGILLYSTCSVLKEESEHQMDRLVKSSSSLLRMIPFEKGDIGGLVDEDMIDTKGYVRLLPGSNYRNLGRCDGFFLAKLERLQ